MANQDLVDRNKILGTDGKDYGFDKILRGYDPKQVSEYIESLTNTNKQASVIFDQRLADLRNECDMLKVELQQNKASLNQANELLGKAVEQRDAYKDQIDRGEVTAAKNVGAVSEIQEKLDKQLTQNRILREENKKLDEENKTMQRDIAHLTKKADKNRFEIKNLRDQIESGQSESAAAQNEQLAQIYEQALEKAEDMVYRLQTEFSLARSKAEDTRTK